MMRCGAWTAAWESNCDIACCFSQWTTFVQRISFCMLLRIARELLSSTHKRRFQSPSTGDLLGMDFRTVPFGGKFQVAASSSVTSKSKNWSIGLTWCRITLRIYAQGLSLLLSTSKFLSFQMFQHSAAKDKFAIVWIPDLKGLQEALKWQSPIESDFLLVRESHLKINGFSNFQISTVQLQWTKYD